ncbi:leucine-rich repeat, immunoglobulin-like domain and transmembrane domain-containing protein 2 isoform 2-T2 [Rhynchonycteris naso]
MASVSHYFLLFLVFLASPAAHPSCLPECTCSEETFGRALQCTSVSLGKISGNLPEEFKHVRIEHSSLSELPRECFINMSTLEYLWLNFDNVTVIHPGALVPLSELKELRLEGNKLHSVPWMAFRATPLLRVLDLKHNKIDVLPELALQFLVNLTYLDLSSNRLTVVSKIVFLNWPAYQKCQQPGSGPRILSGLVLSLHSNPWLCDCRLRGLVQFVKSISFPAILVNPYLVCQGPLSKVGQLFHETELSACVRPQISTPDVNVTIQVGQNVTLRCLAQGSPLPTITWTYALSMWRQFNGGNAYFDLRVVKQTVRGILLEWMSVADVSEEKWFTLYVASDVALRREVVHIGPGINTYIVDDLLPGTKYKACLSLGGQPPHQGQCVVFVTGRDHGGLDERVHLLHITVVLCMALLAVPVGAYVWAVQASCRCREWGLLCCPCHGKAPRCSHPASQHQEDPYRDHAAVCEDGLVHRDTEEHEEKGQGGSG